MPYEGQSVPIPLGSLGLQTDGPQSQLPVNAATTANNVSFYTGLLSKANGSARYNTTSIGSIIAAFDWWPNPTTQKTVAVTASGNIYIDTGDKTFQSATPIGGVATQTLNFSSTDITNLMYTTGPTWTGTFTIGTSGGTHVTASIPASALQSPTGAATIQAALNAVAFFSSYTVTAASIYQGTTSSGAGTIISVPSFVITMYGTTGAQSLLVFTPTSLEDGDSHNITGTFATQQAGTTTFSFISSGSMLPSNVFFVAGGAEVPGDPRRLFILTPDKQVQMITGTNNFVTQIPVPAADWSSTFPTHGCIYNNRFVAFLKHTAYGSTLADQTNFSTTSTTGSGAFQYSIYPGEGDSIVTNYVYKGALLAFKQPYGVYNFTWTGNDPTNPANISITRLLDSFAVASPHAIVQVGDDLWGGTVSGSIFSLKATNAFGSLEAGDLLANAMVRNYYRANFDNSGIAQMQAVYYAEKNTSYFTGRDASTSLQNRMLVYDTGLQNTGRISTNNKDQANCMFMRKDSNLIPRPYYGSSDGFIYQMDTGSADVNGVAYTGEFTTPASDFSFVDPKLGEQSKIFEFITATYQTVGSWAFYIDVIVDGATTQTITFNMVLGSTLDTFVLDKDRLGGSTLKYLRMPIRSATGKTLSLRIYNDKLDQTFIIEKVTVDFRTSGEQNKG